jgi:hypothetical protein
MATVCRCRQDPDITWFNTCHAARHNHECTCDIRPFKLCRSTNEHKCACPFLRKRLANCVALKHRCMCMGEYLDYAAASWASDLVTLCKAKPHNCICTWAHSKLCRSLVHPSVHCICAKMSKNRCHGAGHRCICTKDTSNTDCLATVHTCTCRILVGGGTLVADIVFCRATGNHSVYSLPPAYTADAPQ